MVDEGLLILPGWMFRGEAEHPAVDPNVLGHYRLSFSEVTVSAPLALASHVADKRSFGLMNAYSLKI